MPLKMNPTSVIKARLGITPNGKVHKFFTETCAKAMDKYVPYREGMLSDYNIYGTEIWYEQPYAEYQYYGERQDGTYKINPDNRTRIMHPLATSYWDKEMWTAHGEDIIKQVQDKIDRG